MPPVFSPDGFYMTTVTSSYADKALARGEVGTDADTGHLVVIPQPINELTEAEKRAIRLAKERAAR
jgi:hypothetical protein